MSAEFEFPVAKENAPAQTKNVGDVSMAHLDMKASKPAQTLLPQDSYQTEESWKSTTVVVGQDESSSTDFAPVSFKGTDAMQTPKVFKKPLRLVNDEAKAADDFPLLKDLITWKSPTTAFCALVTGCGFFMMSGRVFNTPAPMLSGFCSVLGCMLALNFLRGVFSTTWLRESKWSGSTFEALVQQRAKDCVEFLMLLRDEYLCSEDPWTMLTTCVFLMTLRSLSYVVSIWSMAAIGWAILFVCVPAGKYARPAMAPMLRFFNSAQQMILAKAKVANGKLGRKAGLGVVALLMLFGMVIADNTSRGFMILCFLMFARCSLRSHEISRFQSRPDIKKVVENPLLRSAFKTQAVVGAFADDVLMSAMKSARKHMQDEHED